MCAQEPAAQLLLPSRQLEARSTFEVRFAAEMVAPENLGKAAETSPLVFDPPLAGRFVWLSTRSGSFAANEPLPLGTRFKISLRPGLKDAAGSLLKSKMSESAETPPLRVKGAHLIGSADPENATSVPRFLVLFNADVRASAAAKFCHFEDASGKKITARLEQANDSRKPERSFPSWESDDHNLTAWSAPPEPETVGDDEESDEPGSEQAGAKLPARENILFVAASKPLPAGKDWCLVLDAGIPAAEGKTVLPQPKIVKIGNVMPFGVKEASAESNRVAGRRVILEFSKALSPEITSATIGRWLKVEPAPQNLKAIVEGTTVTLVGDFSLGAKYRVSVAAGLPASEPTATASLFSKELKFEKYEPRLYFQDVASHQYLYGTRQLRLLVVNVPRVRVSARLFTGAAVPAAVKAFDKYEEAPPDATDESYSRIDATALPGKLIWEKEFTPRAAVDSQQIVPLNWDEMVGANHAGAVLFTAESIDPVSAQGQRVGTQSFVQLTDLGAVWKRDAEQTFLHVFSLASGKGLTGVRLQLLDKDLHSLGETRSNAQGEARFPKTENERSVFLQTEADSHLIDFASSQNYVPLYRLGVNEENFGYGSEGRFAKTIFLFTERGVYKPGDKVHLKGFARDLRHGQPSLPAGKSLTVTFADAKERQIFSGKVTLSEFGSFEQEITLPAGTLGRYEIAAVGGKEDHLGGFCSFQVEEYRPNAFEILIPPPRLTSGNAELTLPITAKYFMGKPLAKAKLTWSLVSRDDGFNPEGLSDFAFCNSIFDFRLNRALDRISQFNAQGELAIGENGTVELTSALPVNEKAPQPRAAKLLCEVTDLNQETVSDSRAFVQQSSEFYFGLRRIEAVAKEGEPLPIELIAVQPDGKPLDKATQAKLRLTRINWQTNRLATAGGTSEFVSTPQLQVVWERELATVPGLASNRKPNVAKLEQATAGKPGEYLLEAIGQDAQGHAILTSLPFEVSGAAETDWNYRNPYVIELTADKDSYEPGETATILAKTPTAGEALVTIERGQVLRSFVAELSGNAPSVQVPIEETDSPNIFVSVLLLRGANESPRKLKTPEYRIGYCNLKVALRKEKLSVQVKATAPSFRPGETVRLDAEVRDWKGNPATDAEVTLYAVDEGILSLTGYETPDPLAFFNQPRGLGVSTSLTLPTLLREDLAEADFANKGYLIGDGKGGPAQLNGLRKNFIACPFWNATLRTDAQGHVQAEFAAPDSLTRYRIVAVAATKESQLGVGQSAFEINKPIMIESAMPAFANIGDKLVLRAVVHNSTDAGGEAKVTLHLDERGRAAETTRTLSLGAHASVAIDFPVEVLTAGTSQWNWSVVFTGANGASELNDAVQATIDIGNPAPLIRQVQTSRIEGESAQLLRISDPQILEGNGEVTVGLTNTRVIELREALRQLLYYPYGCVEQTTSSILPWLTVRDLRSTLPELAKSDEEIAQAVDHGVQLLLSMQTSGGGLSYWPKGREPILWGSAYGGLGLTLAKKQGFAVPEAEYARLLKYLSEQLRGTATDATGYGLSDRCLAVYTLAVAGKAEPAYHVLLFQKRAKLSAEDRALVALAILESKGPKQMIDDLLRGPSVDAGYVEQWFGSLARENALQLLAWTNYQPRAPRVDELAVDLFARRSNGHWTTTQSNAWSLLALASYLRTVETGPREASGTIAWGPTKKDFSVSAAKPAAEAKFPIDHVMVRDPITLSKNGGQLFSEVTVSARSNVVDQPRQDVGYAIARRYAKIADDGILSAADELHVGDRILVTLDIEARRRATYVALEDPLPSVFAPINPAFKSQETRAGETIGTEWISDHSELRKDRAVFFVDLLNPGHYTLRYLARVVAAGEALAPAAKIEEMYHPDRFGTTETRRVSAAPLP